MKKRISKTRQTKIREKELKSALKFGVELVLILAIVTECTQLFFYGKNVVTGRSNDPAVRITVKNSEARNNQSGLVKTGEQGNVLGPSLSDSEKDRQQIPETIAPFVEPNDGPGNVVQATPPPGDASLDPAGGKNELSPISGPTDVSKPMIVSTFDDGPYYSVDIRILDTLRAYGGRTILFIVGSHVSDYKDTLKRIWDSGFRVGNHTFNRKNLEETSPEEMTSQIGMADDAAKTVTGFWSKLVHIPYGAFKSQVSGLAPYPMTQWNTGTQDWSNRGKDTIAASVLPQARDGSTVLAHDLYPAAAGAFEVIIPLLATQGYQFVTVSEIYAAKGAPLEVGQVYFSIPN